METLEEKMLRLKSISIYDMYEDYYLQQWDCVIYKEIFHLYNDEIPQIGDALNLEGFHTIDKLVDDGYCYLMKYHK